MEYTGGILGLIILALDIWAIVNVVQSNASTGGKVLWILGIIIFQVIGFICWLIFGPRGTSRA